MHNKGAHTNYPMLAAKHTTDVTDAAAPNVTAA